MRPVLILFGTNLVSYNIGAAIDKSRFFPIAFFPKNSLCFFSYSNIFSKTKKSYYNWGENGYTRGLISFLESVYVHSKKKIPVLFSTDEAIVFWLNNQKILEPYCEVFNKDVNKFFDKKLFYNSLVSNGIRHPKNYSRSDLSFIQFPVIIKPSSKEYGFNKLEKNKFIRQFKKKIIVANDEIKLKSILNKYKGPVIIQQKLDFSIGDEYSCWVISNGKEFFEYSGQHKYKHPDKMGRISKIGFKDVTEVRKLGRDVISKLGFQGIADVQIVKNKIDSKFYVIEMNPRLWCSHEIFLMNGVNIINKLLCDYYDLSLNFNSNINYNESVNWYSSMYNIGKKRRLRKKHTEAYNLHLDNFLTSISINLFILLKYGYYSIYKNKL